MEFIEINKKERSAYYKTLENLFGHNFLNSESDLISDFQNKFELIRHSINRLSSDKLNSVPEKWMPSHILLILTHKCNLKCEHCYLFCNPKSNITLTKNAFDNIFNTQVGRQIKEITISGGEPFQTENLFNIIEHYPVKSVFTNFKWCLNPSERIKKIQLLKDSLKNNKYYKTGDFNLYVSIDKFHCKNKSNFNFLQEALELIHLKIPKINIIISNTFTENDCSEDLFFDSFKRNGYSICMLKENIFSNLIQTEYSFKKNEHQIRITVDKFPLSYISRALLTQKIQHSIGKVKRIPDKNKANDTLCNYVVSPDGRVALYDVFLVPPVPYSIGNFNFETWEIILERISKDPISKCLREKRIEDLFEFFKLTYNGEYKKISQHIASENQMLFFLLLNPKKRIFLNQYLSEKLNTTKNDHKAQKSNKINGRLIQVTEDVYSTNTFKIPEKDPIILMDLHGVILETTWIDELTEIYKTHNKSEKGIDKWLAFNLKTQGREKRVKKLHEITGSSEKEIIKSFNNLKDKYHTNKIPKLKENIIRFLDLITDANIPLYLISGSNKETVILQLENKGILHYFDKQNIRALDSNFESKSKIKLDIINNIIQHHKNNTVVVFEDWLENMHHFKSDQIIYFGMPQFNKSLFKENAELLINNGADYILKNWNAGKLIMSLLTGNHFQ